MFGRDREAGVESVGRGSRGTKERERAGRGGARRGKGGRVKKSNQRFSLVSSFRLVRSWSFRGRATSESISRVCVQVRGWAGRGEG